MIEKRFKKVLFSSGWKSDVTFKLDEEATIKEIVQDSEVNNHDILIPGFVNAHSHCFQYAMAGKAEIHPKSSKSDDFWSWREAMYDLALTINPDEMYAIAKVLYTKMRMHGYTEVVEFHYVHHDSDGNAYGNLSEMGNMLMKAANDVGIRITLIPIFYQKGGFGKDPVAKQRRFISKDVQEYLALVAASEKDAQQYELATVGVGIHSLRGVGMDEIIDISKNYHLDKPFHIHVSEQLKEIEDCIAYTGFRPVEWLLNNVELTDRFNLVHATHLVEKEIAGISNAGASVVLCPSTEGNLGDGIFPLLEYQRNGGKWSIGTDSHIGLNPFEELRLLDYGQRLITHKRDIFVNDDIRDSGKYAISQVYHAGKKAVGQQEKEYFAIDTPLDGCVLNGTNPLLANTKDDLLATSIIYSATDSDIKGTLVNGRYSNNSDLAERISNVSLKGRM